MRDRGLILLTLVLQMAGTFLEAALSANQPYPAHPSPYLFLSADDWLAHTDPASAASLGAYVGAVRRQTAIEYESHMATVAVPQGIELENHRLIRHNLPERLNHSLKD